LRAKSAVMKRAAGKMSSSSVAAMVRLGMFIRTLYRKVDDTRKGASAKRWALASIGAGSLGSRAPGVGLPWN
jgi:hypothetical protein